jgi:uncharacterized protein (DUF2147 family)
LPHEGTDPVCTECDGELKNTKIVGMRIIWDFKKEGNTWEGGKIMDPGNGNTYSSSLWLIDSTTLKVKGYLGPFFRSQIWKRVKGKCTRPSVDADMTHRNKPIWIDPPVRGSQSS